MLVQRGLRAQISDTQLLGGDAIVALDIMNGPMFDPHAASAGPQSTTCIERTSPIPVFDWARPDSSSW
ncbi:MAG TPA: hypothetical protein VKI44_33105 [Acetobacteraceae bacterium]|nr:hypothetical protein [Acetobacteraceae bacterium]